MNSFQEKRLEEIFKFLYQNNAYYSKIMKNIGCNPWEDNIWDIYSNMPYMDKKTLVELNEEILTRCLLQEKHSFDFTSGTSGTTLKCYKTKEERNTLALNIWKMRRKLDSEVRPSNYISIFNKDFESVIGKFYNTTEKNVINLFEKIAEYKPRWISGPISVFEKMAYIIINGYKFHTEGLKVIEFMGEYVTVEKRKLIEDAFNCQTANNYGAQEVWCMAFECTEHNLHIQDKCCMLDYYDNSHENGTELIVTSLNNKLMPIIKYRLGDIGTIVTGNECPCGNKADMLTLQGGRIGDIIYGTSILGNYFFDQLIWEVNSTHRNAIYAFCVEQLIPQVFQFNIVRGEAFDEDVKEMIVRRMKKEINSSIEIEWVYIDSIEFGRNGKLKKFIPYIEE